MPSFIPQQPRYNDPSYIGYSRQTTGDRSTATAIAGLGSTLVGGIGVADEYIKGQIESDIKEGIGDANDQIVSTLPEDAAINEVEDDNTVSVDVFSEEKTQAIGSPRSQNAQSNNQARRLTQAFRAGRITPTYYWGQMSKLSKELKARYPGYSDRIDRQFQGLTGQIPANAVANAQRKE